MNCIDFQGKGSKVIMHKYWNNLVNMIESKLCNIFWYNWAHLANDASIIKTYLLSPCNSVGGDIVTRPFVGGWVSEFVGARVRHTLPCGHDSDYSFCSITFKLHMLSFGWWEEEPYWFWITGSKVKVNFVTLCIRPCGHNSDYSFCPITFKLPVVGKRFLPMGHFQLFSSPEPKAQVSYCHSALSVVRPSVVRPSSSVVVRPSVNFHIFNFFSRTAWWILMKLGRDEVLMVPYKCCCFSARSAQERIQGGPK